MAVVWTSNKWTAWGAGRRWKKWRKKTTKIHKRMARGECEFEQQHHQFNNITSNCFSLLPNNFFAAKLLVIIDSCLPQSFTSMLVSLFELQVHTHMEFLLRKIFEMHAPCTHNVNKALKMGDWIKKKSSNKSTEYAKERSSSRDRGTEAEGKKWSSVWVASKA